MTEWKVLEGWIKTEAEEQGEIGFLRTLLAQERGSFFIGAWEDPEKDIWGGDQSRGVYEKFLWTAEASMGRWLGSEI